MNISMIIGLLLTTSVGKAHHQDNSPIFRAEEEKEGEDTNTTETEGEGETEEDIHSTLTEMGADDYIFTALYQIDMHIDVTNLTGKNPYGGIAYLDTGP